MRLPTVLALCVVLLPAPLLAGLSESEARFAAASYFNHRKLSIFGGSNEIQKNIVAKTMLDA